MSMVKLPAGSSVVTVMQAPFSAMLSPRLHVVEVAGGRLDAEPLAVAVTAAEGVRLRRCGRRR